MWTGGGRNRVNNWDKDRIRVRNKHRIRDKHRDKDNVPFM